MSATERVAALGSRSTISGWAATSPPLKTAHDRVRRRLDYPASLGLDPSYASCWARRALAATTGNLSTSAATFTHLPTGAPDVQPVQMSFVWAHLVDGFAPGSTVHTTAGRSTATPMRSAQCARVLVAGGATSSARTRMDWES